MRIGITGRRAARARTGWALTAALLLSGAAWAQDAPSFSPADFDSTGRLTHNLVIDGTTYTPDELAAWVAAHRADPASLPADMPEGLRNAIYTIDGQTGGR